MHGYLSKKRGENQCYKIILWKSIKYYFLRLCCVDHQQLLHRFGSLVMVEGVPHLMRSNSTFFFHFSVFLSFTFFFYETVDLFTIFLLNFNAQQFYYSKQNFSQCFLLQHLNSNYNILLLYCFSLDLMFCRLILNTVDFKLSRN